VSAIASAIVELTPKMLAQAFWEMNSAEQVEFFSELAKVIREDFKTNTNAYSMGELQWLYVEDELRKSENRLAREMLMTMAEPLYLQTLLAVEGRRS
jgi:hypothetical protein